MSNKESDMFTTTDICKMTGATHSAIRSLAEKAGIETYVSKTRHGIFLYDKSSVEQIIKLYRRQMTLQEIKKNRGEPKTIEQLRSEHPLVTDDRFFKLSYFPDTVPKCFVDE